jgi:hypothetical protein
VENMAAITHRWTLDEDLKCCRMYLECFVFNKISMDIGQFVSLLEKELPNIQPNSLKMKVQNIKQILHEKGLKDTLMTAPLANYSQQKLKAMNVALEEMGL